MDHSVGIQREYSGVLADMVVYFLALAGQNEADVRQRNQLRSWQTYNDEPLLHMLESLSRTVKRPTPDRKRITRIATIRYLAGSNSADYGDSLFDLSDERLQRIQDGLAANTTLRSPAGAALPSPAKNLPVWSAAEGVYADWRKTPNGTRAFALAEFLTLDAASRGVIKWGMKAIFESNRWKSEIAAAPGESHKWNNNYTAPLAREMRAKHPSLPRGFFETRSAESDGWASINAAKAG
jgi:hypothetical protein